MAEVRSGGMSMISEQIQELRDVADGFTHRGICRMARQAADTIEELSAKLASANMERSTAYYNDGWIPCSERLPEEEYDTVLAVTDKNHYCVAVYTTEHGFRTMDIDCVGDFIAWKPLPEPYRGE